MLMISLEITMTSSVAVSVEASEVCLAALEVCLAASLVEVDLEISVILEAELSLSNSPVFHLWVAQALLQPKLKPLSRTVNV